MKISIQKKLLGMCLVLVLLTIIGISATYYVLTKQDKRRESLQRIQIAFEIIRDDFLNRTSSYPAKLSEFLQQDSTLSWIMFSYQQENLQFLATFSSASYLSRVAEELKKFGHAISADRLVLYGADKRLLIAYHRDQDQEYVGAYVISETENDTYLAMDDYSQYSEMLNKRKPIPDVPLPAGISAYYEGEMPGTATVIPFHDAQQFGLRILVPTYQNEAAIGLVVCEIFYTQPMIERYALLSKTDINFFAGNRFSVGTLPAQTALEPETLERINDCGDILTGNASIEVFPSLFDNHWYYQGRCVLKNAQDIAGVITVSLSQDIEKAEIRKILTSVLTTSAIVCGLAFGFSVLFSQKATHSIQNIVSVIVAAAEGDLRRTAVVMSRDEFGMLATKLNQMISQLRKLSGQVQSASYAVNTTADTILQEMETLIQHMEGQSASVDNTTVSMEKIKEFIDIVAQNTDALLSAAAQILSSIQETRTSIEEITTSTGTLTTTLHLISSSVDQVDQSMKQISENTEQLEEVARQTEIEIQHIDQSLRDVSHNADRTQQLAKETMDAATSGQASVEASMQGMTELKSVVSNTAKIIREVNSWGEQVSSILDIVDDITEQTSLLALNAAIISAQAGVHGRGFAVVADEIKELATRTQASTKEIGILVYELQKKTEEGVNHTEEGLRKADQGMQLASAVKEALTAILERATRSSQRAENTAQVIQQTADSSQTIRSSMKHVTEMVSHIKTGIQDQEKDMEQMVAAVENISGMAEQVNRSNIEQKKTANQIAQSMADATEKFSEMAEQTETLRHNSDQIVIAMNTINSTTEQILQHTATISGETVKNLIQQSDLLQQIVQVFKVS